MPQGISNHPIDQMNRAQKNIQKGNDSCFKGVSDEGRVGAIAGAIIGALALELLFLQQEFLF